MNKVVKELMKSAPKLNENTLEGNTNLLLNNLEYEIENIIISSLKGLDKRVNLQYVGLEEIQPDECKFIKFINIKDTDVYYVKYKFIYNDGYKSYDLEYPLGIPFSNGGNIYKMNGMQINLLPVMSNKIISTNSFTIFLRLFKDKFDIMSKKILVRYYYDGNYGTTCLNCIYSKNHAEAAEIKEKSENEDLARYYSLDIKTPIPITLLGKYGWKETIGKFYNLTTDDLTLITSNELNTLNKDYIAIAINDIYYIKFNIGKYKDEEYQDFIAGVAVACTVNTNILDAIINSIRTDNIEEERFYWRIIFGLTKNNGRNSISQLKEDSRKVFDNQEHFLDKYLINLLETRGIKVNNFFELMGYILKNFKKLIITKQDINDKFLDIYYYLVHKLNINFYSGVVLQLNRHLSSNKKDNFKMVTKAFENGLKVDSLTLPIIMDIADLVFAKTSDHYNDFLYLKSAGNIAHQEDGRGVKVMKKNSFVTEKLKTQDILTTSLLCIKKKKHSPKYKLNIYLEYDENGEIVLDKEEVIEQDNLLYGINNEMVKKFNKKV